MRDPVCANCGKGFRWRGRPARVPQCPDCIANPYAEAVRLPQRAVVQERLDAKFDIVWSGGEGLSSGGGCALADIR